MLSADLKIHYIIWCKYKKSCTQSWIWQPLVAIKDLIFQCNVFSVQCIQKQVMEFHGKLSGTIFIIILILMQKNINCVLRTELVKQENFMEKICCLAEIVLYNNVIQNNLSKMNQRQKLCCKLLWAFSFTPVCVCVALLILYWSYWLHEI